MAENTYKILQAQRVRKVVLISGSNPDRYLRINSIWFDWQVIVESVWVLRKVGPSLRT